MAIAKNAYSDMQLFTKICLPGGHSAYSSAYNLHSTGYNFQLPNYCIKGCYLYVI